MSGPKFDLALLEPGVWAVRKIGARSEDEGALAIVDYGVCRLCLLRTCEHAEIVRARTGVPKLPNGELEGDD